MGAQPGLLSKRSEEENRIGCLCTPHSEEWMFLTRVTVKEKRRGVQDRSSLYSSVRGVAALTRVTDKNNNRREHPTGPPYKVIVRSDWPIKTH